MENEKHWLVEPSSWGEERSRRRQRGADLERNIWLHWFFFFFFSWNSFKLGLCGFYFLFFNSGSCFTVDFFKNLLGASSNGLTRLRVRPALHAVKKWTWHHTIPLESWKDFVRWHISYGCRGRPYCVVLNANHGKFVVINVWCEGMWSSADTPF